MANPQREQSTRKPKAICISDIHYNLNNLQFADAALRAAIKEAESLKVPVIIAGDLHDSKANLRGECIKVIINTIVEATVPVKILVGNHSLINERGKEHALEFLRAYADIIDEPKYDRQLDLHFIPYQHDPEEFRKHIPKSGILIMHQGVKEAWTGDYVFDKTAVPVKWLSDLTVISGHYHRHQTVGTVTYCGSPYTQSFGEASDGPKGFLVLYDDGSFEHKPLNLRKHVIIETWMGKTECRPEVLPGDLLWIKLHGSTSSLSRVQKDHFKLRYGDNYKLDKIPTDSAPVEVEADTMTSEQVLDTLIDGVAEEAEFKTYLKQLWRELL